MHDSDWLAKAYTLSLIGYTSTCETAVRHSDWLYRLFSHVKIKHIYSLRHRKCGVRSYIHELFVSKPERARYERVRAFDTNNE